MDPLAAVRNYANATPFATGVRPPMGHPAIPQTIPFSELGPLVPGPAEANQSGGVTGGSFADLLGKMVADVQGKQAASSEAVTRLLGGEEIPLHQAVIAMEEASVSFQLMVEVRNKLLESYQELMRMQI